MLPSSIFCVANFPIAPKNPPDQPVKSSSASVTVFMFFDTPLESISIFPNFSRAVPISMTLSAIAEID